MDIYVRHYDFKIGGKNAGYYMITSKPGYIVMVAMFTLDGKFYENLFELKHDGHNVTAYKTATVDWQSMELYGANHYPTSAYPLLLAQVKEKYVYIAIDEGTGEIQGETTLERNGEIITETRDGKTLRLFRMKDDIPVEIDWGRSYIDPSRQP